MIPRLAAALALVLLGACAALGPKVHDAPPYDLLGRVLVSYEGRAFTSNLRWVHRPGEDEIWLLSPLGQTLAYITDGAEGASITGVDRQIYRASSVESLTQRALGWEMPVPRLRYWVLGEVYPGSEASWLERDASDRLLGFKQDGWSVRFDYDVADPRRQPRRVEIDTGAVRIRLVIDTWRDVQ
jgi:outer membrane lipoprotein LolB